jgi:hypothetical protein
LGQVFGLAEFLKNIGLYMLLGMKGLILYKPVIITDTGHKTAANPRFNSERKKTAPRVRRMAFTATGVAVNRLQKIAVIHIAIKCCIMQFIVLLFM